MNTKLVEDIAAAVLYEGYLLYPYRASSIKNQQRWNFGVLYPRTYAERQSGADRWWMQTECLARSNAEASIEVRVRFLHIEGQRTASENRQRARERSITLPATTIFRLTKDPLQQSFSFPGEEDSQPVEGSIEVFAECCSDHSNDAFKIRVRVENTGAFDDLTREEALTHSLVSAHTILGITGGEFVSLLDPPDQLRDTVSTCQNLGTWPVLVGAEGERDAMLSSPIILYDYPQIAPESPGALFDGTEIDEILTLRILTLTDAEKMEMGLTDDRAREILERTENMPPEQFMKLHGVLRGIRESPEEAP